MKQWQEVAKISEFEETDRKLVDLGDDRLIGIFKVEDEYFALDAYCSHQKASMVHGDVDGYELMCPLHGARFDLRTGKHLSMPAVRPVATFAVKVDGDAISIKA